MSGKKDSKANDAILTVEGRKLKIVDPLKKIVEYIRIRDIIKFTYMHSYGSTLVNIKHLKEALRLQGNHTIILGKLMDRSDTMEDYRDVHASVQMVEE